MTTTTDVPNLPNQQALQDALVASGVNTNGLLSKQESYSEACRPRTGVVVVSGLSQPTSADSDSCNSNTTSYSSGLNLIVAHPAGWTGGQQPQMQQSIGQSSDHPAAQQHDLTDVQGGLLGVSGPNRDPGSQKQPCAFFLRTGTCAYVSRNTCLCAICL